MNTNNARAGSVRRSAVSVVLDDDRVEGFLADQLAHLAVREHLDGRVTDDPVGQVARHVLAQLGFADDERQSRHVP